MKPAQSQIRAAVMATTFPGVKNRSLREFSVRSSKRPEERTVARRGAPG
jgi:hypothetical protein